MQRPSPVALARQDLGTFLDMVMALQALGPLGPLGFMAKGRLMTVEIRGVDLTLSQALNEQYTLGGITNWINNLWENSNIPACNKPVRTHCKAGSVSARLGFETRAKC